MYMNTGNYCKQLKNISVVTVLCCVVWLYWTFGRMTVVIANPPSVSEGYESVPLFVAGVYALSSLALVCVLVLFLYNQIKSLKNGTIFSKQCQYHLFTWAAIWPFYDICASNMDNMQYGSFHVFSIDGSAVGITIIVFTFALLYKIARQVAEDNQLTI